jgi:hypothetical protein
VAVALEVDAKDRHAVLLNAGPADADRESSLDRKRVCLIMISFVSAVV